jgi:uncharacterized membrane protein YcaP (DUF421 family)
VLELKLPWWELLARAASVYLVLLVMVRMSGKRTVGQFTPFDLLVVMLLSESVSNALSGGDDSLLAGFLLAATLIALNLCVGVLSTRSRTAENLIEGAPVLLGRNGHVFKDTMKQHRVGQGDIDRALRSADCTLEDMRCLFLESNGSITVLRRQDSAGDAPGKL